MFIAALMTASICFYGARTAEAFGLVDRPDGVRKIHAHATPLLGGFAVLIPTLAIAMVLLANNGPDPFLSTAFFSSTLLLVLGILDDRFQLRAFMRLAALAIATTLALALEPTFILQTLEMDILGVPLVVSFGSYAGVVTLLMVVGYVNASNMADGMNGQLLGSVLIWSLFLFYAFYSQENSVTSLPYLVLASSSFIALMFNLRGRIFSGSAGSYGLSLFIGISAIAAYNMSNGQMPAGVPLFWFYLPVLDCLRVSVLRIWLKRSPLSADRNHFHHILLGLVSAHTALVVYLALLAAPGIAAIIDHKLGWITLCSCVLCYAVIIFGTRLAAANASATQAKDAPSSNDLS